MRKPEKLILIKDALETVRDNFKPKTRFEPVLDRYITVDKKPFIKRHDLRQLIQTVLCITDSHTINNWVNLLIGKRIIQQNPHTHKTKTGKIKPSNDIRYFITVNSKERQLSIG